jgi:hypothetical protein
MCIELISEHNYLLYAHSKCNGTMQPGSFTQLSVMSLEQKKMCQMDNQPIGPT